MMSFVLVWQHLQISLTLSRYMIIINVVGGPCASFSAREPLTKLAVVGGPYASFSALEPLSRMAGDDALCLSLAASPDRSPDTC